MSVIADLVTWLKAQPSLAALVGARVYPVMADPNDIFPCLVVILLSEQSLQTHDGVAGLDSRHYQFSAFGKTPEDADAVRAEVKTLLQPFSGALVGEGTVVSSVEYVTGRELYESITRTYHFLSQFKIWYPITN